MSDLRSLIESLHLEDIDEDKVEVKEHKFNMDGNIFEEDKSKREHKKQKHPHVGLDNRGKWQRTDSYSQKKSLEMKLKWQEPEWREYMIQQQTGVRHVFVNKRERVDGHIWSEEARRRYSEKVRDTMYINNGLVNKRLKKDQPIPEGWQRGLLDKKRSDI